MGTPTFWALVKRERGDCWSVKIMVREDGKLSTLIEFRGSWECVGPAAACVPMMTTLMAYDLQEPALTQASLV
jgi:hypothetical protein